MDLTAQKVILQNEELKSGIPASEGIMQRAGKTINFANEKSLYSVSFELNGQIEVGGSVQNYVDNARALIWDYDILGVLFYHYVAGTSGSIIFDLIRRTPAGATASIFSTKPEIPYTSGNYASTVKRFTDSTLLRQSAGTSDPSLNLTQLNAGDVLELNLLGVQADGLDAGLTLFLRPR